MFFVHWGFGFVFGRILVLGVFFILFGVLLLGFYFKSNYICVQMQPDRY